MDPKTLYKISYGMYLIGSSYAGKKNCQIANTVFQVTSEPKTIAISINKENFSHDLILKSRKFSVSVLRKDTPVEFIHKMGFTSGSDVDKLEGVKHELRNDVPVILDHAAAYLVADVINELDAGTHTVFLGRLTDAQILDDSEILSYTYYRQMKSGSTPMTAPTYNAEKENPVLAEPRKDDAASQVQHSQEKNQITDNNMEGKKMEINNVYRCAICGNIMQVNHVGGGTPVCCGEPMILLRENTTDAAVEKHVPIIEKTGTGFRIKIGSVAHPMEEKHYIQWVEIIADNRSYKKFLRPGDKPEAEFQIKADHVIARGYCNLHSLWKS